jgi:hypothetical protein
MTQTHPVPRIPQRPRATQTGIGERRRYELERLTSDVLRAGRTIRSATRLDRATTCRELTARLRRTLEQHAAADDAGLRAIQLWLSALAATDPGDVDRMQELLYGIDALVRVHIWRETGLPLEPPPATAVGW